MANVNAPRGLIPTKHLNGNPWNGKTTMYYLPATDGTAVFIGDLVKTAGTSGAAGVVVAGQDVEGMMAITRITGGTTGQDIVGVVAGFLPDPTRLDLRHRLASTARIALVVDDPTVLFELQEDADTTPIAAASVGLNAAVSTTAGSATTGLSGIEIDSSSVATTATLPVKIHGLIKRPDNNLNTGGAGTDKAKFLVQLNTHFFAPNVAGV